MEIWKDIEGYEGLYQVSNKGRVKSLSRFIKWKKTYLNKPEVILCLIQHNFGYNTVRLSKDGKVKIKYIHRLVATAFIPNPNKFECVMHKDDNPINNNVSNLSWGSRDMNNKDMGRKGRWRNQHSSNK